MTAENTKAMASGTFRLKGSALLEHGIGAKSMYELAKNSKVSYPTIHKYVSNPADIKYLDLETLAGILVDGLGLNPDELAFSDVFEFVPHERKPTE